ncbi:MAG: hypothetical protein U1E15_04370 [Hyphomicrobiales bacterium]
MTADGKRYLVLHGDKFDGVACFAPCAGGLAIRLGEISMSLNGMVNSVKAPLKLPYWSLSVFL